MTEIDVSCFMQWRTEIRVDLNWQILLNSNPRIWQKAFICNSDNCQDIFSLFYTPWYLNLENTESRRWCCLDATPVSICNAVEKVDVLRGPYGEFNLESSTEALEGPFPAYALNDEKFLLLDGNHRLCRVYKALRCEEISSYNLGLIVIKAPICGSILPDLKHFVPANS
jgi:hypothetical protein